MVAPGVFHWQAYDPEVKCDLSSIALETQEGLLWIDPIPLADAALADLASRGTPLAILLTSGNHERAADVYRRRFDVPVCASAAAAEAMGIVVDEILMEESSAPGGMDIVAISSAGPGEVAFAGHGVACVGDALIHLESHGFALLPAKYCADARRLPNDLKKLLSYDFRILTFAHGAPLTERSRQRLETLLL